VRTALLAAAAAATFAVVDALTKSVVGLVGNHGASALLHWQPYVLCAVAIGDLFLGQSAFQSGAILDSVEPIGAVLIGATVFAERLAASPAVLAAQVLGGLVAVAGVVLLDRSPLMVSLRNDQEAAADKLSQDPVAPDSG